MYATVQKFGVSNIYIYIYIYIYTLIQQGHIKLIKNDRHLILQNISFSNKCFSFDILINQKTVNTRLVSNKNIIKYIKNILDVNQILYYYYIIYKKNIYTHTLPFKSLEMLKISFDCMNK